MAGSQKGADNHYASFTSDVVRKIRLRHYCDGLSSSALAREFHSSASAISRIVRFVSYIDQDLDLRGLPRPTHQGGNKYHQPKGTKSDEPAKTSKSLVTCRQCIHLTKEGRCGLEFPECLNSAYKEAVRCSAFVQIQSKAGVSNDG